MKKHLRELKRLAYLGNKLPWGALLFLYSFLFVTGCSPKKLGAKDDVGLTGGGAYKPVRPVYPKNTVLAASVREKLTPGTLYVPPEFENAVGTPLGDYLSQSLPVGSSLDIAIEPGVREVTSSQQISAPLNLYFAIDVSASMQINIDAVKASVSDLVAKLKASGLTPKIGLVTFRDEIVESFPATEDVGAFRRVLERQITVNSPKIGLWEASLLGIKQAAELLQRSHKPGDSNAILVVSDNPGHMGSENCSIDSLVNRLNSFSSEFQKSLHIYGSVRGDTSGEAHRACDLSPGSGLALDQFEDILSRSLLSSDLSKRGGVLDFPLSSDVILGQLVRIIQRTAQAQRKVCLTKSFSIFDGSKSVGSWPGLSLSETYGTFVLGEALIWKNALTSNVAQALRGKNLQAKLERCCILEDQALIGNFSSCQNKSFQVDFAIEK